MDSSLAMVELTINGTLAVQSGKSVTSHLGAGRVPSTGYRDSDHL